ncbi:MAG: LemA family protein [Paludibacteraceae bacterium]|nr:LemA family protein [Paludibacteraceae bacterium]MCQ2218653.1 LemA family protein [Paludibacteraceae bacterium]
MIILIVAAALLVVIGGYFIATQRNLVALDERVKNSLSQIGVQLKTRWDAITLLAKMVEKYSKHEHDTLMDAIAARRSPIKTAGDAQTQQNACDQMLARINAVAEQYPQLRASELYTNTMNQINEYENNVRMSRQIYNDTATRLNSAVRQWPTSIVAGMLDFKQCEYLHVENDKTDIPTI